MKKAVVYIHGKGGSSAEAERYDSLFPGCSVIGLEYSAQTPWEAQAEFPAKFAEILQEYDCVMLIANSIGAYFAMHSLDGLPIEKAVFISPIADMERLIANMMLWAGTNEADLKEKGTIETAFGETLSWEYLCWVRNNPINWTVPTDIIYGSLDNMQPYECIKAFAEKSGAALHVLEGEEHWFHTPGQLEFIDSCLRAIEMKENK